MAKKGSLEVRHVVCCIVHGQPETADRRHIFDCFQLVLWATFRDRLDLDKGIVPKATVFVEGSVREEVHNKGPLQMLRGPRDGFDALVALYESGKSKKAFSLMTGGKTSEEEDGLAIAIGSRDYCMAFAHGMAMAGENQCQSWGMHMVRELASAEAGKVVVFKSDEPKSTFVDELGEMYRRTFPQRG